ncbi:MAG: hypothetical protein SPG03_06990 [Veillonella caviae]|nr:hypothetical protein [Veillonella caviae]
MFNPFFINLILDCYSRLIKIAVGTKAEGESSSLELGTAKLSEALYMEGDVKIKSNLLQGIEEKKNEVKKNTESYLKTKGEN